MSEVENQEVVPPLGSNYLFALKEGGVGWKTLV